MINTVGKTEEKVTLSSVLEKLMSGKPTGEVNIADIEKECSQYTHSDLLGELRKVKGGKLIVGRRGHQSRFVWGVKNPARKPQHTAPKQEKHAPERQLCVTIGDSKIFFPVSLELVA